MHFTIHQLEILLKIIETKSFTKASEELFMTQPAVSIQLKKLQDQFDIPLVEVVNRKTHITEFGLEVGASAKRILDEVAHIQSMSMAFKGLVTGKLKVMSVSTGKYVLPYLLGDFLKQHPGVELHMDVTNKQMVTQALEENSIDFGLISVMPSSLDLNYEDLMNNELFLVGSAALGVPKHKNATKLFNGYPIIYREAGSGTRITMEEFLKQRKISLKPKLELTSNEAVKQAVLAGLGYAVMPQIGIKQELDQNKLVIVPVDGLPITTTWKLVWLKNKKMSPAAQAYLDFVKENKQQLIENMLALVS